MGRVTVSKVNKNFGTFKALDSVDLEIKEGEFFSLLGPSGSGKTTLLRMIAGFFNPDSGSIAINGRQVDGLTPDRRNVAMVFQSYALFPHRNVFSNVAFGLEVKRVARDEIEKRVMEALRTVKLDHRAMAFPTELSGGQQQRVAIARSIVLRPSVLLMDEPLSALDRKLRGEMQVELRDLQRQLGITTLYVTHDQEEALAMSDRIAVMQNGRVEQVDTCTGLFERPSTRFVADFLGCCNVFAANLQRIDNGKWLAGVAGYEFPMPDDANVAGESTMIAIRPERITFGHEGDEGLPGQIANTVYLGSDQSYLVTTPVGDVTVRTSRTKDRNARNVGEQVLLQWHSNDVIKLEA